MNINWYPGHMKKTIESLQSSTKMVDIIVEILDARIPKSSSNPLLEEILGHKKRIKLLNKADLANPNMTALWVEHFKTEGIESTTLNSLDQRSIKEASELIKKVFSLMGKSEKFSNKNVRIMVVGIPNSGKSTFINSVSKRKGVKTGNKPGVTKSNQWIKTAYDIDLLDTPGVLWPKFEDENVGMNLALTGAIKDEILDRETLTLHLIGILTKNYGDKLMEKYGISSLKEEPVEVMEQIGVKRGCLIKGGEIDYYKTSNIILSDFRSGGFGNISLERP